MSIAYKKRKKHGFKKSLDEGISVSPYLIKKRMGGIERQTKYLYHRPELLESDKIDGLFHPLAIRNAKERLELKDVVALD
jgi:hypothetical protein